MNDKYSIHPETKIRSVTLNVADLDSMITFYERVIGFRLLNRSDDLAILGTSTNALLTLKEEKLFKRYKGATGLYHFAILFPERRELARAIARLYQLGIANSPTDHIMTKTTYLSDPEGNGIELYCESPEDGVFTIENNDFVTRRSDGTLSNGREPLDLQDLFKYLSIDDEIIQQVPDRTRIGHVHLYTPDAAKAVDFYHGVIGFDIQGYSSTFQAAFVSAGGYHHHLGLNAWLGLNAPTPPDDALGLNNFEIGVNSEKTLAELSARLLEQNIKIESSSDRIAFKDPFNNGVVISIL